MTQSLQAYRYKRNKTPDDIRAFLQTHVDTNATGCHITRLPKDKDGYGVTKANGQWWRATRLLWLVIHGSVPADRVVMHLCDTPSCVNIEHLALGSNVENVHDRHTKGRDASGDLNGTRRHPNRVLRGEQNPAAKLSAADVIAIRASFVSGAAPELAAQYGVSATLIHRIVKRKVWRELLGGAS